MTALSTVLALDIASGGVTANLIGSDLKPITSANVEWTFVEDDDGAFNLSATSVMESIEIVVRTCTSSRPAPDAIVLSSLMHTLIVLSNSGSPRSPVFTWNDCRNGPFMEGIRERLGNYTFRTGCYFHPALPSFKLAWLRHSGSRLLEGNVRLVSLKSYIQGILTDNWSEDVSTASSSGLLDLRTGEWDRVTLDILEITSDSLPKCINSAVIAGELSAKAAGRLGLSEKLPVVAGAGDGFFAAIGSGCHDHTRAAVTLGTTAAVRRFIPSVEGLTNTETFCYRYNNRRFLNGIASSNGGNVLDWATDTLGPLRDGKLSVEPPIFMPFLNLERGHLLNPSLRPRWIRTKGSSLSQLKTAVIESQAFGLALYFELTARGQFGIPVTAVLSGNGFGYADVAPLFAALVPAVVLQPNDPGQATIKGAASCGFEALGLDTQDEIEKQFKTSRRIEPFQPHGLEGRYDHFKKVYFEH